MLLLLMVTNVSSAQGFDNPKTSIPDPSCQLVTQSAWKRGFVRLPWLACLIGLIFPWIVWTPMVKFQVDPGFLPELESVT